MKEDRGYLIDRVANGWMVRINLPPFHDRMTGFEDTFVFENVAALCEWLMVRNSDLVKPGAAVA